MRDVDTLGPWLERFLLEHIVTERNLARNTQKSYRDTFALLMPFLSGKVGKPPDRWRCVTSRPTASSSSSLISRMNAAARCRRATCV